ncbi:MAG: hypothetical protein DMF61_13285 [Blastocatellia bacterium AA13]|nr:MAG: hypothetical protein DMF61_13285 [Blastocatellia bacterium AA13]
MNTREEQRRIPAVAMLTIVVVAAGAAAIAIAAAHRLVINEHAWLVMAALALLIAPVSTIKIPGVKADIVLGDVVTFTCAALFGPSAAVIAAVVDGAVTSLRLTKSPGKYFYNVAVCAVSMAAAAASTRFAFPLFGQVGQAGSGVALASLEQLGAIALFTFIYFIVSTILVAGHIAVSKRIGLLKLWRENFLWSSISYIAGGAAAFTATLLVGRIGFFVVPVVIAVMAFAFAFYRTYFAKVELANERVESIEKLNYNVIETLAASIGAMTSSVSMNLRRVDALALEFGRVAGCSDEELKALRVAALLHDVGNIVVPHQILEKPGSLSSEEYDLVKQHVKVGAAMVQAINFPYPVADIIRHHHERFDGCGYPGRLKGDQIPLPGRILAIVDCYDALTTDRPYRSRLTRENALSVMHENSGKMFDPMLLDKFLAIVGSADDEALKAQSEAVIVAELRTEIISQIRSFQAA